MFRAELITVVGKWTVWLQSRTADTVAGGFALAGTLDATMTLTTKDGSKLEFRISPVPGATEPQM